jgi:hypothetical protein
VESPLEAQLLGMAGSLSQAQLLGSAGSRLEEQVLLPEHCIRPVIIEPLKSLSTGVKIFGNTFCCSFHNGDKLRNV